MKNNEGACAVRLLQYNRKRGEEFYATEQALIISVTMTKVYPVVKTPCRSAISKLER